MLKMLGFAKLNSIFLVQASKFHTSRGLFNEIIIPAKIKRGPTDILKAIASTVKEDPTRASYKYHDDPYLIPIKSSEKRMYILSKESGQKAARWILDKHSDCFTTQPDDPIIKKFLPRPFLDENAEDLQASEELLNQFIDSHQISSAIKVYEKCKIEDLSSTTLQKLLECICFSNEKDLFDPDYIEIFHFNEDERLKITWKDGGIAEDIFEKIKHEGPRPYCAIIRGMCKFGMKNKGWKIYQEALEKELVLDSETMSYVISAIASNNKFSDQCWQDVEETISNLLKMKLQPTLSIMNSILEVLAESRSNKSTVRCTQVLREFKNLNIEPSLATYYYVLDIFYKRKNAPSDILTKIIDHLEGTELSARSLYDNRFFFKAMTCCYKKMQDWGLATRINELLHFGNNYRFIGNNIDAKIYYRNFLLLAIESLPLEESMKVYENLVPHKYSLESPSILQLVKTIKVVDGVDHLPRLWSDALTLSPFAINEDFVEMVLSTINNHSIENASDALRTRLANIAWSIYELYTDTSEIKLKDLIWTPSMLSDCISILARCQEDEKVTQIRNILEKDSMLQLDNFSINCIENMFLSASRVRNFETCYKYLLFLKEKKSESFETLFSSLKEMTELSKSQIERLEAEEQK